MVSVSSVEIEERNSVRFLSSSSWAETLKAIVSATYALLEQPLSPDVLHRLVV